MSDNAKYLIDLAETFEVPSAGDSYGVGKRLREISAELARVKAELDLVKTGRVRWIVTYGERWYGRQENGEWESFDTFDEAVEFARKEG